MDFQGSEPTKIHVLVQEPSLDVVVATGGTLSVVSYSHRRVAASHLVSLSCKQSCSSANRSGFAIPSYSTYAGACHHANSRYTCAYIARMA